MIKITRNTVRRQITEEEFKRMKNSPVFKALRTSAKGANFSLLFGASSSTLNTNVIELDWSEERVDNFIEENNLYSLLENIKDFYKKADPVQQKYLTVATKIRNDFFQAYPGLLSRITRERDYASHHGFCRSYFGMTRNLIELMLRGEYDKEANAKRLHNLENIAANVRCQNMEACIRGRAMYEIQSWLIANGYKSWIFNEIHDSMDFYIYKPELHDVLAHIKHVCERKIPELKDNWIPLLIDVEIADLTDNAHQDCYKHGRSWTDFSISSSWNDLQFEDPDPFNVELSSEFEQEYFEQRKTYWRKKNQKDPYLV